MMKKIFFAVFACLSVIWTYAQNEDSLMIRRIADDILINKGVYEDLRFLCKKIGPRLSGSANAQKAVEATMSMLKEAGADTVYLQPVMVPHWVRGEKEQGIIKWGSAKKALHVCALGMSVGTAPAGLEAELIEVANFDELRNLGADKVRGKIVFFNYPMRPELINGGYGDAVRYRSTGPVEAAKLGALAIMIRSVTHALDDNPHTGSTRYSADTDSVPAMACSTRDAEWLHELLKKEKKVRMYMKMSCKRLPDVLSYNVVGELRGTVFPGEIITAGGHLDSWDLAEGAHDDGSGCMQSIQIIRTMKRLGIEPKRTIRVVMFMNEENGLAGGRKYAELAGEKNEHHLFAIESDSGGFGVETLGLSGKPDQVEKARAWMPLLRPYGIYDMPAGGGGADIGPLRRFGALLCGVNPATQRYFDYHHAPNDVFEAVHKRELEMGAIGMTAIVCLVDKYGL